MKNKTILIIDDEPDLVKLLEARLKKKEYEVLVAYDGESGLKLANDSSPNLIILDINMPKMNGLEFYNKMCNEQGHSKVPIVVLTARGELKDLFHEIKAEAFISKPFEIDQLLKEVETIIKRKSRSASYDFSKHKKGSREIFIVENEDDTFQELGSMFFNAGYKIQGAKSGFSAIDKMIIDPPELALIQLGLVDVAGDIVVERLLRIAETVDIKFLLFVHKNNKHDQNVLEKFAHKPGVVNLIEYDNINELLDSVDLVFAEE